MTKISELLVSFQLPPYSWFPTARYDKLINQDSEPSQSPYNHQILQPLHYEDTKDIRMGKTLISLSKYLCANENNNFRLVKEKSQKYAKFCRGGLIWSSGTSVLHVLDLPLLEHTLSKYFNYLPRWSPSSCSLLMIH